MPRPSLKENVVAAALGQFHRRGYNGSGVKDITDAAGLPKGSFYNYFSSKEEMAVEALQRYGAGRELGRLKDPSLPPLERLRAHFVFLGEDVVRVGVECGCMFGNFAAEIAGQNPVLRDAVATGFARWVDAVADVLHEAVAAGEVGADRDVDLIARTVVRGWEGTVMHAKVTGELRSDEFFAGVFEPLLGAPATRPDAA
ncbi:MAG TPA: TetR family transcriptional regulator C-terminal domain-containing protein [Pseudonocardia sp.]|jgi:TetR/AcrR family transcriptional repressor of nem operon|nr:TetR family transcriptional regulator C-terminal domain-containing protein [Pseudonocardia sp.]